MAISDHTSCARTQNDSNVASRSGTSVAGGAESTMRTKSEPTNEQGDRCHQPPSPPPTAVCQSVTVRLQSRTPTTPTKNGFAVW